MTNRSTLHLFNTQSARGSEPRSALRGAAILWDLMRPSPAHPRAASTSTTQPNMLDPFMGEKNMATGEAPIKVDPTVTSSNCRHRQSRCRAR